MAQGKNKVIVYRDWLDNFEDLTNEELGKLMRHFFEYINDLDPVLEDRVLKIAWKPIESTLKRDLTSWSEHVEKQRINGKKGGRPKKPKKASGFSENPTKPKKADSVSDSDSVKDNERKYIGEINPPCLPSFLSWLEYRKEIKKPIKIEKTFKALVNKFNKHSKDQCDWVVNHSIENGYTGLFWDKYTKEKPKPTFDPTKQVAL